MRSSLSGRSKRNPLVKFIWGKLAVRWSGRQMELLYLTTQVLVFREQLSFDLRFHLFETHTVR